VTLVIAGEAVVVTVVPLVKKLFAVGSVTPVTTVVSVVVPFRNGTVSKGPIWPGLLTLVNTISPLLLVSGAAAGIESKRAAGGALFGIECVNCDGP
jgi:hypothetical protein